MTEKLSQELKRTKTCLRVAEELSFLVWATPEISGEEYVRLQSAVDSAADKLEGRFDALNELDKQLNPYHFDNYYRMRESYWKYSALANLLEENQHERMRELRQAV